MRGFAPRDRQTAGKEARLWDNQKLAVRIREDAGHVTIRAVLANLTRLLPIVSESDKTVTNPSRKSLAISGTGNGSQRGRFRERAA